MFVCWSNAREWIILNDSVEPISKSIRKSGKCESMKKEQYCEITLLLIIGVVI